MDYTGRCRDALNSTGLSNLPEVPAPFAPEPQSLAKTTERGSDAEKPSVLDEIRESRSTLKEPTKPKPEKSKEEQTKKKNQTEL